MRVHLNGGPLHGKVAVLEPGVEVLHINEMPDLQGFMQSAEYDPLAPLPAPRVGHYSRVRHHGVLNQFEWDGYQPR
jgi:hypothetical protein